MRLTPLLATGLLALPAFAQNWYAPDNAAATGSCNTLPFGAAAGSATANVKFQTRVTRADLGNQAGSISGLAFSSCLGGRAHYDRLVIVLAHLPPAQSLSTTFAANLNASAVTVLDATNYTWNLPANAWAEVGLQTTFAYNGVDDLLVQITTTNGNAPTTGFHRGTRERVGWSAATGTAPATGTLANAAIKLEVSMRTAHTSSHGDGCSGSNGVPVQSATGLPQVGTTFALNLANGTPNGVAVLIAGLTNGAPYPVELGPIGMPGCWLGTDIVATAPVLLGATGNG
ncbi:MAG: hypothetical protein JNK15_22080, partial [Planctomycetes bacterium]|nr:hypothetical protein [Planctomycetota bacterium]